MNINRHILNSFIKISNESIDLVNKWRLGNQEVLTKVNPNGQLDVVTELDYQIELNAKKFLNKNFPDFEFIGEEGFKGKFEIFDHNYFVIDPIDGTKSLVKGSKDWGISICCVIDGRPTVSLLNIPDKNLLITGIKGKGIQINGLSVTVNDSGNQKIAVSPRQSKMVEKYLIDSIYTPQEISALIPKVASVISGKVGAALYFPEDGKPTSIWDYAAACFLLQEAGGTMKSFNGNSLPYSGEGVIHEGGWIAAGSNETYTKIKKIVEISYNCI